MKRRRHTARMIIAAAAVFATAFVGGTLHAALSADPVVMASGQIHEAGVARFVTTDTGITRAITTKTTRSPLQRFLVKLGFGAHRPIVMTDETAQSVHDVGVATVTKGQDGNRTLTIETPSEWVFELRNE